MDSAFPSTPCVSTVWKVPFDLYRMGMGEGKLDIAPRRVPFLLSLSQDPQLLLFLADSPVSPILDFLPVPHLLTHIQAYLFPFFYTIPTSSIPLSFNFYAEKHKASNDYRSRVVKVYIDGGFQTKPLEKVNQCLLGKEDGEGPLREQ